MVSLKSQDDVYVDLVCDLLRQDPCALTTSKSLRRDIETVRSRTASEGLSFLTKTLPKLGKALDEALECSTLSVPAEFARAHGRRGIPAYAGVP